MIPLIYADVGEENIIKKVSGNPDEKTHLTELGFTPGKNVTVISKFHGNIIVNLKETRIAISREMARQIMV